MSRNKRLANQGIVRWRGLIAPKSKQPYDKADQCAQKEGVKLQPAKEGEAYDAQNQHNRNLCGATY